MVVAHARPPHLRALDFDFLQPRLQRLDDASAAAAGRFELRFARAAQADGAAALAVQDGSSRAPGARRGGCSCASSTCSLPSCEVARWAKMSRIRPVRSTTRAVEVLRQVAFLHRAQGVVEQHQVAHRWRRRRRAVPRPCRCPGNARRSAARCARSSGQRRSRRRSARVRRIPPARLRRGGRGHAVARAARVRHRRRARDQREAKTYSSRPSSASASASAAPAAGAASLPGGPMRTLRAGTTVEMACL